MKDRYRRFFSISKKESKYFDDKQDYIELVNCSRGGETCAEHRSIINKNMLASHKHLINKEYNLSIEELKTAFYKTNTLKKNPCHSCAKFFRSNILNSMERMHKDLEKMSSGIFSGKRLKPHFELATQTLEELRKST